MRNFITATFVFSTALLGATTGISLASDSTTGLEIVGQQVRNVLTFYRTKYEGDCPGETMENPKAYFVSQQTPTGDKRRVRIENVTAGLSDTPYTDREYEENGRSETTTLDFGAKHSSKFFRIQPGENRFAYRITEQKTLIESGEFTAMVNLEETIQQRNAEWRDADICANSAVSVNTCADLRAARQFVCPNGPVLKTEYRDRLDFYRTVLSNRSDRKIEVEFNHQTYRLYPGEAVSLQTPSSSAFSLSIRYRLKDGSWQYKSVTAAKYMQFRENFHSKQLELVDRDRNASNSYKFREYRDRYESNDRWRNRPYRYDGKNCNYDKCDAAW